MKDAETDPGRQNRHGGIKSAGLDLVKNAIEDNYRIGTCGKCRR